MHSHKHNTSHSCQSTEGRTCTCGHDHGHKEENGALWRIVIGAILLALAVALDHTVSPTPAITLSLYLLPYLTVGYKTLLGAVKNTVRGAMFDENFLMSIASVGAFFIGEYVEGVAVMLLFCLGEYLEGVAVGKTRASVVALMEIRPDTARIISTDDGEEATVPPEAVAIGTVIEVRPGERIPLDGTVTSGCAGLDASALTGESVPRPVTVGDFAPAGCICLDGVLHIRTTHTAGESTVQKILDCAEYAEEKKTRTESFITRFARVYTPIVVLGALVLAVVPSLIWGEWQMWIYRALTFLVVSCPCALVISVPLSFFSGIGGASKRGILIKGSSAIEALSKAKIIATDKTGTLTRGAFSVVSMEANHISKDELLAICASVERSSTHPVSRGIVHAYEARFPASTQKNTFDDITELSGRGIRAMQGKNVILCGNERLLSEHGIVLPPPRKNEGACAVYVAQNGAYLGAIYLSDTPKDDAADAVGAWRALGVKEIHMLTGDTPAAAAPIAKRLALDGCHAGLLPDGKLAVAEALLSSLTKADGRRDGTLLCIGDGINDTPLLSIADVGCAMGALGSDAAIASADVVILNDAPTKVAEAISLSRKTVRVAKQNIVFALSVKALILLLGAIGLTGMGGAVFGDVGVCLLCIFNASRLGRGIGKSEGK